MKVLFKIILLAAFIFASCSTTHAIGKTEKGVVIGSLGTIVLQELGILNVPHQGDPGYRCGYQLGYRVRYRPNVYRRPGYRYQPYGYGAPGYGVPQSSDKVVIVEEDRTIIVENGNVTVIDNKPKTKGKSEYKW